MVPKGFALRIVLLFLFSFIHRIAMAQPTLPDISGSVGNGIVALTWNCQYAGVKDITVLHATDSLGNYSIVGNVKKLDKGIQVFVDGHPVQGKNFYKLTIVFKSGLRWGSNYCRVFVKQPLPAQSQLPLPPNDSLQKLIVTGQERPLGKNTDGHGKADDKTGGKALAAQVEHKENPGVKPPKISITFDADSANINLQPVKEQPKPAAPKIKINISFDDPSLSPATFIKPLYVFTDPVTGYVNISLPDNIKGHHYALKFFDQQNHLAMDVPTVNASKIIMDKRNFQHGGLYKFVLRKDGLELETGYITIN